MKTVFPLRTLAVAFVFAAAPQVSHEDVELRWRWKVSDVLRYRMTMTQVISNSMMPDDVEINSAFVLVQEVKEVSPEGVGTVAVSYEACRCSTVRRRTDGPGV